MKLRRVAAASLVLGVIGASPVFATYARVESMGKNTMYIMDDVSIFDTRNFDATAVDPHFKSATAITFH